MINLHSVLSLPHQYHGFLHKMVAHFTMRTYGVNHDFRLLQAFGYIERVVESDIFFLITYFTSYLRNMFLATILYKYHDQYLPHTGLIFI